MCDSCCIALRGIATFFGKGGHRRLVGFGILLLPFAFHRSHPSRWDSLPFRAVKNTAERYTDDLVAFDYFNGQTDETKMTVEWISGALKV